MKEPVYDVSRQILELVEQNGGMTLFELEQNLDVSYNLIFLAIDNMVASNQLNMKKCGRDYFLTGNNVLTQIPVTDSCMNEYLWQDV
ncbi:MAG: hypothetical protein HZA08_07120 [Nitrospirae bacterium]|nr:hypothetical protein [Nitrospirota bacterium]